MISFIKHGVLDNFPMCTQICRRVISVKILIMHQYLETGGNFEINIWNASIDSSPDYCHASSSRSIPVFRNVLIALPYKVWRQSNNKTKSVSFSSGLSDPEIHRDTSLMKIFNIYPTSKFQCTERIWYSLKYLCSWDCQNFQL